MNFLNIVLSLVIQRSANIFAPDGSWRHGCSGKAGDSTRPCGVKAKVDA